MSEEQGNLNYQAIWKEHGGKFHGPCVEHVSMEASKFSAFCRALIDAASPARPAPTGEALEAIKEMVENCADAPTQPDCLPAMILAHVNAALSQLNTGSGLGKEEGK